MSPRNALGSHYRDFDGRSGVFTLPTHQTRPNGASNTAQWAVSYISLFGNQIRVTTGEKILIGVSIVVFSLSCFIHLVLWALGSDSDGKKVFAQAVFSFLYWAGIIIGAVFIAKTIWKWLP